MSKQSLGRLVQRTRQANGLSQYALAKAAGISVPYLQRLEHGEYDTFPSQYLENVGQVLGLSQEVVAQELEKADRSQPGFGLKVLEKPGEASETESAAPVQVLSEGAVDISGDQPLLSLVPPVDPERLMADIAMLPDEDQKRVAEYVRSLMSK